MKSQHVSASGPVLVGAASGGARRSVWRLLAVGFGVAVLTLSLVYFFDPMAARSGSGIATATETAPAGASQDGDALGEADGAEGVDQEAELPKLTSVGVSPSKIALAAGGRHTLTLRATLETGGPAPATRLVGAFWESSNSEVVSVGPDGELLAESLGEAVVTVRIGEHSASVGVAVGDRAAATLGPPGPPTQVAVWQDGADVLIRWEAPAAVASALAPGASEPVAEVLGNEVRVVGTTEVRSRGKATSLPWPDLVVGERYRFEVRSRNEFGWSEWSLPSRALTVAEGEKLAAMAAPELAAGRRSATASWGAIAAANSYLVELDSTGDGVADASTQATASLHRFGGLVPGASVSARIAACSAAGCGPKSAWSAAVTVEESAATTTTATTLVPSTTAVPTSATTTVSTTWPTTSSVVSTTSKPTTSRPTTSHSTTSGPTTSPPTTSGPTTTGPTTSKPTVPTTKSATTAPVPDPTTASASTWGAERSGEG